MTRGFAWKTGGPNGYLALLFCLVSWMTPLLAEGIASEAHIPQVRISPTTIEKTSFYSGCHVRIEGSVGSGSKAVIAIRGPQHTETFRKKLHIGPIWLNSGKVQISGVPSVFLCFSSDPLEQILNRKSIDQYELDGKSIARHMQLNPDEGAKDDFIGANYLALRIKEDRYRFQKGRVSMEDPRGGDAPFSLEFDWPKTAPSAHYEVWLYEVRDGAVTASTWIPLEVKRVGFPALIANLAYNHSSEYGIMAVLIAVMAGFGIDLLAVRLLGKRRVTGH